MASSVRHCEGSGVVARASRHTARIKWQDADMARFDAEEEAARNNQRSYAYGGGGYMYGGGYGGGYGSGYGY